MDAVGRSYGIPPSELRKMDWNDLLFNYYCIQTRKYRIQNTLKKQKSKKSMEFPNLSLTDMIDIL